MVSDDSRGRQYFRYAGLGLEFTAVVGLFLYLGYQADKHWNIEGGWGLIVGAAVGLISGIYLLVKEGNKMMRELDSPSGKKPDSSGRSD